MEAQFFLHASPCPQPLYWPQSSNIMKNLVLSLLPKSPQSRVSELFFFPHSFLHFKKCPDCSKRAKVRDETESGSAKLRVELIWA